MSEQVRRPSSPRQSSGEVEDLELEPGSAEQVVAGTPKTKSAEGQKAGIQSKSAIIAEKEGLV